MKRFGLVGYPLGHSFSKELFEEKFEKLGLKSHRYDLFEMEYLKDFPALWHKYPDLVGVNVTVPHKINIIRFLDHLDSSVHKVEAINVIKKKEGKLVGYNSDAYGFKTSLEEWLDGKKLNALVLGSGGSSLAVQSALGELSIPYEVVSRHADKGDMLYTALLRDHLIVKGHKLIINTTPLGMYPNLDDAPPIPYDQITKDHFLFDLVYNPAETLFMKEGKKQNARIINGLDMLKYQAEKSWEIWNS